MKHIARAKGPDGQVVMLGWTGFVERRADALRFDSAAAAQAAVWRWISGVDHDGPALLSDGWAMADPLPVETRADDLADLALLQDVAAGMGRDRIMAKYDVTRRHLDELKREAGYARRSGART